jgi:hypothetical protein
MQQLTGLEFLSLEIRTQLRHILICIYKIDIITPQTAQSTLVFNIHEM